MVAPLVIPLAVAIAAGVGAAGKGVADIAKARSLANDARLRHEATLAALESAHNPVHDRVSEYGNQQLSAVTETVGRFADWIERNKMAVNRLGHDAVDGVEVAVPGRGSHRCPRSHVVRPRFARSRLREGSPTGSRDSGSCQYFGDRRPDRGAHRCITSDREEVSVSADGAVVVAKKLGAVVEPLQVLQTVVGYADKWVAEVQRAKTERAEIAAWEQVQTDKIRAQRDVLLKALDLMAVSV